MNGFEGFKISVEEVTVAVLRKVRTSISSETCRCDGIAAIS